MIYVIGNGPSLQKTDLNKLIGHKTYAVNRIWKIWEDNPSILWRPTDYVRGELPAYNEEMVIEDLQKMSALDCTMHLQAGFWKFKERWWRGVADVEYFDSCNGDDPHDWHLPNLCGYGTVVNISVQIAVLEGADEIHLLGCDLGLPNHFYGAEGTNKDSLPISAHEIAKRCSPIPIYNATIGGSLEVYPRCML